MKIARYLIFISVVIVSSGAFKVNAGDSCIVDGLTYRDGASWASPEGCQQCRCSSGLTFCVQTTQCQDLGHCAVIVTLPGACCPACLGCVTSSGEKMNLNDTWQEDDCTHCSCHEGRNQCMASLCHTTCLYPRKVAGECCPVCDDDCHLHCLHGRVTDADGKLLCQCRKLGSAKFAEEQPLLVPGSKVSDDDDDGADHDQRQQQQSLPVMTGSEVNGSNKMAAQGSEVSGSKIEEYDYEDAEYDVVDGAGVAAVGGGVVTGAADAEHHLVQGCLTSRGAQVAPNATWHEDDCTHCTCAYGRAKCVTPLCTTSCLKPRKVDGECCPVCDDDCDLECHYGRVIEAGSGRSLCQCRTADMQMTAMATATVPATISSSGGDDDDDEEEEKCLPMTCNKMCAHGFTRDHRGCPLCKCQRCPPIVDCHKKCPFGFMHDSRGCPMCHCRSCAQITCPKCRTPVFINGQCCPTCNDVAGGQGSLDGDEVIEESAEPGDRTLVIGVLVCVSLVAGVMLILAIMGLCVARQCRRLQLHEENVAAAVKLTAVHRLRPKSTNLDFQYNLYMQRYREPQSNCWSALEEVDKVAVIKEDGSHCSNSPLLQVKSD